MPKVSGVVLSQSDLDAIDCFLEGVDSGILIKRTIDGKFYAILSDGRNTSKTSNRNNGQPLVGKPVSLKSCINEIVSHCKSHIRIWENEK